MQSAGPPSHVSRAANLPLVAGRPCLDFVNTTSGRGGPRRQEHLQEYAHLIAWAAHARLIDAQWAAQLTRAAAADPIAARRTLVVAIGLREAIHDILLAQARGEPRDPAKLAAINAVLADGMGRARLLATESGFAWDWPELQAEPPPLAAPLWPVARSAAELLVSPWRERVRECPGEHCGWLFLDLTKNGSRRWCEMKVCGSRAKMQRYRQRRRRQGTA